VDGRRGQLHLQAVAVDRAEPVARGARHHLHVEGDGAVGFAHDQRHHFFSVSAPNSRLRLVAASTALMSVVRRPPASSVCSPAMAVPPGEVTMSLRRPGCSLVSISSFAEPRTVWAARAWAL